MLATFKENIRKNEINKERYKKENDAIKKMLRYFLAMGIFVCSISAMVGMYGYLIITGQSSNLITALVSAAFIGGILGIFTDKTLKEYFKETIGTEGKTTPKDDDLFQYLIKELNKDSSDELIRKYDAYQSETNEIKKRKLMKSLAKEIEAEISLNLKSDLNPNRKTTYLKIIGSLVDTIKFKGLYSDQNKLAEDILASFEGDKSTSGERGLSPRNLAGIFAEAKTLFSCAQKRHKSKQK